MGQTRQVLGEHLAGCLVTDSSVWSLPIVIRAEVGATYASLLQLSRRLVLKQHYLLSCGEPDQGEGDIQDHYTVVVVMAVKEFERLKALDLCPSGTADEKGARAND